MPVVPSSYTPPALLSGGHLQTLYASLLRRVNFTYERRDRIETPDDDFLDLDWAESHHTGNQDRVAILVHGLEGNTKRTYMRGMARALTRRRPGWDVCAINLRGCSEEMNRRVPTYHSGKTDDLEQVIRHVLQRDYETVGLVGFSLGGNIVLKYLAEQGSDVDRRIRRAATFSVPVDLKTSSHKISQLSNWHYTQYFLRSLRRKIRTKAERHPGAVETAPLQDVHNLRDFDDAYTAPLHGFRDADDYYRRASSKRLLPELSVPTLLVNAANDPFLPRACYPTAIARKHDALVLEVPDSGGHVGFVSFNESNEYWSERRAVAFLSEPT